jgi:photosystem II stability/assembly factor-like uncharacterized protein
MKKNTPIMRNSLSFTTVLIGAVMLSGFYLYNKTNTRQYHSGIKFKADKDEANGALGMQQYFFNARKSAVTGKMDVKAMALANNDANKAMQAALNNKTARQQSSLTMNWTCLGPSNIGGRTRGILIDNLDPTHNTLFATAVSGGIWKSTNGGGTWDSVPGNDQHPCLSACDIAQDKNGVLYVGTGEGFSMFSGGEMFSTEIIGGGMFKSTDDGNTWTSIASTNPGSNNNTIGNTWSYINRIAIDPNNPSNIYAATNNGGLMYSGDGGTTWNKMTNTSAGHPLLGGNALDVKISADGSLMIAFVNGKAWYAYPNSSLVTQMTILPGTLHHGGVYSGGSSRMEIAISPTNPNYAYISVIPGNGLFGTGAGAGGGIYMTMTAKNGTGGYWYNVGPSGSNSFDPYSSGGLQDQATYDNAMGVDPSNPGRLLAAGTILWQWEQINANDTVGTWTNLTTYQNYYQPIYVHPDMHVITFDLLNTNVVYDGNDGGVYKSVDGGKYWTPVNRNYNVTQFNDIAYSPAVSAVRGGFTEGEGVMGGTQDNGTPYISGIQYYYEDALDVGGGDGGMAYISQLNPNIEFVTSDFNSLNRGGSLTSAPFSTANLYTNTVGDSLGCNLDSLVSQSPPKFGGTGCFYHQFAVYENSFDTTKNLDMMTWISDSAYPAGHTVYPVSPNAQLPFPYKLKTSIPKNDTLRIKNAVVSKLACGFSLQNGVWMMMQADDITDPAVWMPIGGPLSTPDAFPVSGDPIHCLAWSPDGDALFIGTEGGQLFRLSNLDSVVDLRYNTGALYSIKKGGGLVANNLCRVKSTHITTFGDDVLSIAIDPKNGNHMMVTLGNYSGGVHIYYTDSALGLPADINLVAGTRQGTGLPDMPVYSSVIDVLNSGFPNSAIVGTERGIYTTTDITIPSPVWTYSGNGIPNTLVSGLRQQVLPPWNCNNAYNVYVGTHGRGAWVSSSFFQPTGINPVVADAVQVDMKVYPNPLSSEGTLEFNLPAEMKNVTVTLFDISGRVVKTIALENQAVGEHLVKINVEEMSTGTYIASVSGDGFHKATRFVVVK